MYLTASPYAMYSTVVACKIAALKRLKPAATKHLN